ncbi:hypothetical protein [Streptomyces sp. 840.1]|uniref:hypothetical protein n=1 Tax=Streptomyces sp. 840.1 TaxID=2485152 RepID=UPI000F461F53|nr:hypothetical protein [Streptomyces sp. 840.1]
MHGLTRCQGQESQRLRAAPAWRSPARTSANHERTELAFDANSYAYPGLRACLVQDTVPGRKGAVTEMQAALGRGVVNSRDETPRK